MTILHIDSSINGENSASRAISHSIVEQLKSPSGARRSSIATLPPTRFRTTLDAFADTSSVDEFLAADIDRHRRADVQFHAPEPAQGVDRPHPHRRKDLPLHRGRPEGPRRRASA